jgi:hypothetical protein
MPMNGLLLFINTDTQFIFKCAGFVIKHNPMTRKPTGPSLIFCEIIKDGQIYSHVTGKVLQAPIDLYQ